MNIGTVITRQFTAGTTTDSFKLLGRIVGSAIVGRANSGTPTITLQEYSDINDEWLNTGVTATASTSAGQRITPETLALEVTGNPNLTYRWLSSASVTLTVKLYLN